VSHCSPADHFAIFTKLSVAPTPLPPPTLHLCRRLHSIDIDSLISFVSDLQSSDLITNPPTLFNSLLLAYNSTLFALLDKHAPVISSSPDDTLNLHLGLQLLFVPLDLLFVMPKYLKTHTFFS